MNTAAASDGQQMAVLALEKDSWWPQKMVQRLLNVTITKQHEKLNKISELCKWTYFFISFFTNDIWKPQRQLFQVCFLALAVYLITFHTTNASYEVHLLCKRSLSVHEFITFQCALHNVFCHRRCYNTFLSTYVMSYYCRRKMRR